MILLLRLIEWLTFPFPELPEQDDIP